MIALALHSTKFSKAIMSNKKIKVLAVGGEYGFIEYNLAKWTKWGITTSDIDEKLITKYPTTPTRNRDKRSSSNSNRNY